MTTLQHPVTKKTLKVLRHTVADGKTRRSSTGSSTACSAYPIPEAPEHSDQLGDMSLVFEKPVWTVDEIEKYEELFPTWLKHKQDNPTNRREFAKEHYGCKWRLNIAKTDLRHFYPPVMHRALRSAETIGRRVGVVAEAKYGSNCKKAWFNEMAKVAKKSSAANEHKLAFSENGTIAFLTNFRSFLLNSGFKGLTMETLSTFSDGLANLFELLLNTPVGLTGTQRLECCLVSNSSKSLEPRWLQPPLSK